MTLEKELGDGKRVPRYAAHPKEPSGQLWDEDKVAQLFPKLAGKYGYTD